MDVEKLKVKKIECLEKILELYKMANAGHIGSSLSCLDILTYLFFHQLKKDDRFILSKGHAALALYVVLAKKNIIDEAILDSFYSQGTLLAAHPPCSGKLDGITFGTGSLGHGLSLATGFALSNRFTGKSNNVYCVLSEGDCNEGATWEAALFASQHKLNNLFVIIDNNKMQGFGKMEDVINLEPFLDKWRSFNFDVVSCEGNDFNSLLSAFNTLNDLNSESPKCIIARTVKGHGVSFMENKLDWHYLPMDNDQYVQALKEVKNA